MNTLPTLMIQNKNKKHYQKTHTNEHKKYFKYMYGYSILLISIIISNTWCTEISPSPTTKKLTRDIGTQTNNIALPINIHTIDIYPTIIRITRAPDLTHYIPLIHSIYAHAHKQPDNSPKILLVNNSEPCSLYPTKQFKKIICKSKTNHTSSYITYNTHKKISSTTLDTTNDDHFFTLLNKSHRHELLHS